MNNKIILSIILDPASFLKASNCDLMCHNMKTKPTGWLKSVWKKNKFNCYALNTPNYNYLALISLNSELRSKTLASSSV